MWMVLSARVVSFTRTCSPSTSEKRRLDCTLGSQVRRVFFLEKGTLLPYCLILPWKRPSWARLKGCREMASDTWIDHEGSQRAHEALGFEVVDRCVHYRKELS